MKLLQFQINHFWRAMCLGVAWLTKVNICFCHIVKNYWENKFLHTTHLLREQFFSISAHFEGGVFLICCIFGGSFFKFVIMYFSRELFFQTSCYIFKLFMTAKPGCKVTFNFGGIIAFVGDIKTFTLTLALAIWFESSSFI